MRIQINKINFLALLVVCVFLFSCSAGKKISQPAANISAARFLGEYDIPYDLKFDNTTVGGLSSIDYDAKNDIYYMVCDDRSDRNPARFYTGKIFFTGKGIDSIHFTSVHSLLQPNGAVYPNSKQDPFHTPDPEAMRYDPVNKRLIWNSEGERIVRGKDTVLANPTVTVISTGGAFIDTFALPSSLVMHATENGPRQNSVLEGSTFANNYKTFFINVEEPLYEDGPRADVNDNNAFIRLYKFDINTKKCIAQYGYKLEPVATAANPANGFKINGVPDILDIGNNKLLITERSFSTGVLACTIRVFIADLNGATDVSNVQLKENKHFVPVNKKLLLNMSDLGIYIDNIEGATFGPLLPNGHKTLLFLADNNFSADEKAQLLLFEVIE